jgi:hypothetical protein
MAKKALTVKSPVKIISTGTVPTTSTLKKGELAYGVIGGETRYFGNAGSAIIELTPKEYTALANGGITIDSSGNVSITTGSVTEAMLASALQTKINNVIFKNNTTAFTPTGDYNPATKKYVDDAFGNAIAVANGRAKALVFDTKAQLTQWIAGTYTRPDGLVKADLNIGDSLFIKALDTPDYWWDGTAIAELETDVDLSGYYTKTETDGQIDNRISAIDKTLTAAADQKISVGGTQSAVTTTINASAAVTDGGLKVTNGALELDTDDIEVTWTVEEI